MVRRVLVRNLYMPRKKISYNFKLKTSRPTANIQQAVISVDLKGNITSLNRYAETIFDLKFADAVGKNIDKVLPSIFFKKRFRKIKASLKKGESWSGEFIIRKKDGGRFVASIIDSPLLDSKNRLVGFIKLIEDVTTRKKEEERQEFLVEASRELSKTLDYKVTLNTLSNLIVPKLADWFCVDVVGENGQIDLLLMAHADSKKIPLAKRLRENYVVSDLAYGGLREVIRSGKPILYSRISEDDIAQSSTDTLFSRIVRKLGFSSAMIVPLVSRGKVFGAITMVTTKESKRFYDETDLEFAENFAHDAALSLDNANLYQTAQKEIKDRKQTEESLIQLTETLELSQQAGNIGSFEWNLVADTLMWTAKLETLYGLEPGEFGGTSEDWFHLIYKDDQDDFKKVLKESIKKKTQLNHQFRIVYPTGEVRWMQAKAEVFYDSISKTKRMIGVQMDISRRKKLEMDLQHSKDQLNIIFQNVADGITVQDQSGKLIYVNNAAAISSGYENGEEMLKAFTKRRLTTKTYKKYIMRTVEGKPFPIEKLPGRCALRGEKTPEAIINYYDKNSKANKWSLVKARPIFGQNGEVQYAVSIVSDITEQIEAERRKDEFLSMTSHELKTPLTSMKAFVQVLQRRLEKYPDLEANTFLIKVNDQINKLTELITDLLDISRIQAGKLEYRKDFYKFDDLVDSIVDEVQRTIKTHKIIKTGSHVAEIYGDKDRIGQVLINLLTNAVKYSPDANKIYVRVGSEGKKIFVEVQDFGIGIPREFQDKIFNRYFQVGAASASNASGLGIGLYIASQITMSHGGSIKVISEKDKGSTFRLLLPIASRK